MWFGRGREGDVAGATGSAARRSCARPPPAAAAIAIEPAAVSRNVLRVSLLMVVCPRPVCAARRRSVRPSARERGVGREPPDCHRDVRRVYSLGGRLLPGQPLLPAVAALVQGFEVELEG